MVLGHERRIQLGEDLDLLLDILDFVFCTFEVYDLNGDGLLGALVVAGQSYSVSDRGDATWAKGWRTPCRPLRTIPFLRTSSDDEYKGCCEGLLVRTYPILFHIKFLRVYMVRVLQDANAWADCHVM